MSDKTESVGHIGLDLQVNQKEFNNQLGGLQGQAQKTANKMQSSFSSMAKKIAGAIAGAFAVKKIVDFSKECLELGSDLQEVQNVVDVTFPTMRDEINQFAQSAAVSFGLSETMAKKFTGTFGSMAKAFGFSEQQAADMGSALTGLAGDVASFYNITQDEAYTKLKSVFTGETESLKDLGVVMTQTALDGYALANGFGKTTAQMSEAEKVALRYQFVTSQLSAAQGDFARTSGGWANQMRVLNLQFDSLKATIGQGLINLFTPVIQVVNQLIGKLGTLANKFKELTELISGTDSSSSFASAASSSASMDTSTAAIADNLKKANKFLAGFDVVNKASESSSSASGTTSAGSGDTSFSSGAGTSGTEDAKKGVTGLQKTLQKFSKFFSSSFANSIKKSLQKLKDPVKDTVKIFGGMFEDIKALGGPFTDWLTNSLAPTVATVFDRSVESWNLGVDSLNHVLSSLWNDILQPFSEWLVTDFAPIATTSFDMLSQGASDAFSMMCSNATAMWDNVFTPLLAGFTTEFLPAMTDVFNGVSGKAREMQESITATLEDIRSSVIEPITEAIGTVIGDLFESFSNMWEQDGEPIIDAIGDAFTNTAETVKRVWEDTIKPVWEKFAAKISEVYKNTIKPTFDKFAKVISNLIQSFLDIYNEAILPCVQWLAEKLEPAFDGLGTVISTVLETAGGAFDGFLDVLDGIITFIKGTFTADWRTAWNGVKEVFAGIVNIISSVFTGAMNLVIKAINTVIKGINKLSFTVPDWVPGIGGEKFGFSIPTIKEMEVPKLAEGGYVRANTPQLALIGDNRHQGEVVAPEGKLLEMAKMAASMSGGDSATLNRIVALLEVLISIVQDGEDIVLMVGEEELARASARGSLRIKRRFTTGEIEFVG